MSPSNIHDGTFDKNSQQHLKSLSILAKRLILDAWLGLGRVSADEHIAVFETQMKRCKDGRRGKIGSF